MWAKAEKKDGELQNIIAEQKIRTQRILGALIIEGQSKREIAIRGDRDSNVQGNDIRKLSDIGITRNESRGFSK